MTASPRYFLPIALVSVGLTGFAGFQLCGYGSPELSWSCLSECQQVITREQTRSAQMEGQVQQIDRRLALRRQLSQELIEGRRELVEVAAWFAFFNRDSPGAGLIVNAQPGSSHGEKVCRQVIRWAGTVARERSEGCEEEVTRRLEAELDRHLRQHGTVELPAVED